MKSNFLIKREQSQARLGFAECEKSRLKAKILSLLVLLLTVASGAWAQDLLAMKYTSTPSSPLNNVTVSDDMDITIASGVTVTINNGLTIANSATLTVRGSGTLVVNGANGSNGATGQTNNDISINGGKGGKGGNGTNGAVAISGNIIIKGATLTATGGDGGYGGDGGWGAPLPITDNGDTGGDGGDGGDGGQGGAAFDGAVVIYSGTITATGGNGGYSGYGGNGGTNPKTGEEGAKGQRGNGGNGANAFAGTLTVYGGIVNANGGDGSYGTISGSEANAFASDVTFKASDYTMTDGNNNINTATGYESVHIAADDTTDPDDIDVTTLPENEIYFTTAEFDMPAFDATVKYTIVRIMNDATYPVAFSGVNEIIAVKQNTSTSKYEPINTLDIKLIDNISGTDVDIINAEGITVKVFKGTDNNGTITYASSYMTLDAFKTDMQPGYYKIVAEPTDAATSPYTGSVSVETQVLVGLPVGTLANGQFGSYFSNHPLHSDDPNVKIYTIKSVTSTAAVLVQLTGVVHSGTPIVVFNNGTEKNVILMPNAEEPAGGVPEHYNGFKGTLSTMQLSASTGAQWNFVFNGESLIYVLEAINIPANRCYLQVAVSDMNTNAHSLDIVFEEENMTEVKEVIGVNEVSEVNDDSIYDLSGRKIQKPTKKGIYIQNGKKTVIK